MSYPHVDPKRYEGLFEHAERYLGRVRYGEPPDVGGYNRGFGVAYHDHPDGGMVSAVTTGVRFQRVTALAPAEFVCSAKPGQEDEAGYLVHVVAENAIRTGKGMEYGGGFLNAEPLMPPDCRVQGVVAVPHPYVAEEFNIFDDPEGKLALQYITLVPVTAEETEFLLADHTAEDLFEIWEEAGTDVLDMYRSSAV